MDASNSARLRCRNCSQCRRKITKRNISPIRRKHRSVFIRYFRSLASRPAGIWRGTQCSKSTIDSARWHEGGHGIDRPEKCCVARPEGLEPPAYWFEANRSIQLSYGRGSGDRDLMVSLPFRAKMGAPMDSNQIQAAMKELQDAMVVMAHLEARQTDRLLRQEKQIEDLALSRTRTEQTVRRLQVESAVFQRRTKQNLAETTDKLNGLIGGCITSPPPSS
jgi:hypothetical protein